MKTIDGILSYPDGLTIVELKRLIADLPEYNEKGEHFEVWIGTSPKLQPGTVYPRLGWWTYTYFSNETEISCPNTFGSASEAKTAMREFVERGNIRRGLSSLVTEVCILNPRGDGGDLLLS